MGFNKFAVIGVGKYGSNIARRLAEKGAQVFAFDNNEEKIENIKDDVAFAVTLNSTDFKILSSQKLEEMDAAVVAIGENFEATILTAVHLMDLGVKRIIARANGADQRLILEKIGIKEILTPEDEVAFVIREKLLNPSILSFLQLSEEYEIAEIKPPKGVLNRTIQDIDFRNKYQLTLVTMRREYDIKKKGQYEVEQHVIGVPKGDTVIESRDTLVVFGTAKHVQRFIDVNES
ncbi:TrkA family potassium uptake protein [Brumimicrobium glaciale]|jgi:trk system potassium uptake protein TrkA|uniref:TrkA family potassium uptake protein n=1 Tax=Brumimicrobium glaciale TaxID=200475 RepID=A0A4V1WFR0_9FLAO|nr:TrkA family potassium uptake protein [Brumimicrobium glaciale]RYM34066.1 TrkA family potassium uptake protein [Brumimicrobium glaciale]